MYYSDNKRYENKLKTTDKTRTMKNLIFFIGLMLLQIVAQANCVKGDCINGEGIYRYADNTIYIGSFQKGVAHGYGRCYYPNGEKYMGQWENHTFHGKGTFDTGKGKIMTGDWKNGEFVEKVAKVENVQNIESKVYAVIIGVASYAHMQSLKYTDDDAYRMYGFLKSPEGGAVPDEQITLMIDGGATKNDVIESLKTTFAKAGEHDMVMVYYSGHGLKDAILPIDYDGSENKIYYKEIYEIIEGSKAKQKICIIDACHSGGMLAMKGVSERMPTTAQIYYENLNGKAGGTAIVTSSKSEEVSIESEGLRQGIFSHFWIKALKGMADDNNNKVVTISEAFNYVQTNVKEYTSNYQTPQLDGSFDAELPLSVVR